MLYAGTECGVTFEFRNGLLDLKLQRHQADEMTEYLKESMKIISREEKSKPQDFVLIHRMSRMCWEMATASTISNIDRLDASILYESPHTEKFEWVSKILNSFHSSAKSALRQVDCTIVVADHVAKSIDEIMTS